MNQLQQQINDLAAGRHREWHLDAVKTSTYGPLGREWILDVSWEFVAGFDCEQDARQAQAKVERDVAEGLQYGRDGWEFRVRRGTGK